MKLKIINVLKCLMFLIIPFLSVFICVIFRLAQGEKNEEIVFGVMVGVVLDLIYSIILLFIDIKSAHTFKKHEKEFLDN